MIHSFDVFDTLLVRSGYSNRDLLLRFALSKAEKIGVSNPESWAKEWFKNRLVAEKLAKQKFDVAAANFDQIHECLQQIFPLPNKVANEIKTAEREAEFNDLRPITENQNLINQLIADGERVIIISDMYFSRQDIADLLAQSGILISTDQIFVSCEQNATKWKGGLFKTVANQLEVSSQDIYHIGDRFLLDVASASIAGVSSTWYRTSRPNRHERRLKKLGYGSHAGIAKQCRLSQPTKHLNSGRLLFYSDICAPLLYSFLLWLKTEAIKKNITRLYFVARDGWVMKRMANTIGFGDIELKYLYGSRQAWYAAVPDWKNAVARGTSMRADRILSRLGVNASEITSILHAYDIDSVDTPLDAKGLQRLKAAWHSEEMQAFVSNISASNLKASVDYMEQEGLLRDSNWALVDIGWKLSTQAALRKILRTRNASAEVRGFYLGLKSNRVSVNDAGPAWGFIDENSSLTHSKSFIMQFFIIEQLVTPAPHGSTKGYEYTNSGKAKPQLSSGSVFVSKEYCQEVSNLYCRFADKATASRLKPIDIESQLSVCHHFFMKPDAKDKASLSGINIAPDSEELDKIQVVGSFTSVDLFRYFWKNMVLRGKSGYFQRRFMWMAASIPWWDIPMRVLFRALVLLRLHGTRLA